jgi:L-2-hydroxyglutarate oxidase LhgO
LTDIDVAVIGAGVTGLAAARALVARGHSTCVLERHARAGLDTSTHNSGVIHAGIYYPPGSLKARLCVEGRRLMYAFCARYNVPHRQSGKLIVAHDDGEVRQLEALKVRGEENGVEGLELVDRAFIVAREPAVSGVAALWSPESGVVEAEALVKTLVTTGADAGAILLPGTRLIGADRHADGMELRTERESIRARTVVNAAGLYADDVSRLLGGETFTIYPCRGEYVELTPSKRSLVNALVYPGANDRRPRLAWADRVVPGAERRLREPSSAGRSLPRAGPPAAPGREARGSAARRQRHPGENPFARRVVRGFSDPPRSRESIRRPGIRYRVSRVDVVPGRWRSRCLARRERQLEPRDLTN